MTDVLEAPPGPHTEAQTVAGLLFPLGRHLATFSDLPAVDIYPELGDQYSGDMEVAGTLHLARVVPRAASALARWADTLGDAVIDAEAATSHCLDAYVRVIGTLIDGQHRVLVWTHVRGFSPTVGLPDPAAPQRRVPVTVACLLQYDDERYPLEGHLPAPDAPGEPDTSDAAAEDPLPA